MLEKGDFLLKINLWIQGIWCRLGPDVTWELGSS